MNADILGTLRDTLMDMTDLEKSRAFAADQPEGLVFQMRNKIIREKGKPAPVSFFQSFSITYMMWYSEFLCSKAVSGTTVFSPSRKEFCTVFPSSTQAEFFTHPNELDALVELVGIQGIQFMEEKLTRIITLHVASVNVLYAKLTVRK